MKPLRLAVIAARAGSKGLPGKNIKSFNGSPLLAHSVKQAVQSQMFDCIAVSSDSDEYLEIGREAGANLSIKRPDHLCNDTVSKPPVLIHTLQTAEEFLGSEMSVLVDLQPTSPLRRSEDIRGCIEALESSDIFHNVISVCEADASPYYNLVEYQDHTLSTVAVSKSTDQTMGRRQDIPATYQLNGSIYAWKRAAILKELPAITDATGIWIMPDWCNFDIDTPLDFELCEYIARSRNHESAS